MASVASQLVEEVTAPTQSDSLEDAREICADGTYFPNNLRTMGTGIFPGIKRLESGFEHPTHLVLELKK